MRRRLPLFALLLIAGACSSSSPPPPPIGPAPALPAGTDEEDADTTGTARPSPAPATPPSAPPEAPPEAPAFRTAPERWWHEAELDGAVPGAGLDEAYRLLGSRMPRREVVVAVIDGGVDVDHEDLDDVLWVNEDEVPGNGVDDDGNGYPDDVHGWNFLGNRDGRSVEHDTYEMTRLHAACLGEPAAGGTPDPGPAVCAEAAAAYEAERTEMSGLAAQIGQIRQVYPIILQVLRSAVGGEPTVENVSALRPRDPQTTQARAAFLQLEAAGIDADALADQAESISDRLQYGLDLGFDPRPIVGDDYADPTERVYGNPDVEGPDPGHGTAVAAVVAAERDNGVGIDGAARGVRIMAVRAVPEGDERDKDVANAIRYAVDNGADVINMSFGKGFSPWKSVVDDAVRYADEHGVLMVHAAGNDGDDLAVTPSFPTDRYLDGGGPALWIEVGASSWGSADSLAASFSNYGAEQVDVFAPGVAILSAAPDDAYEPADGTSLAAPVVSGVAALLMAYFPELDAADVRRLVVETARRVGDHMVVRPGPDGGTVRFGDLSVTGGVVDAAAAVRRALAETAGPDGG